MDTLNQARISTKTWRQSWPWASAGQNLQSWLQRGWWAARNAAQVWVAGAVWQPCLMVGNGQGATAAPPAPVWSVAPAPAGQQTTTPLPLPAWLRVLLAFQERGRGLGLLAATLLTGGVFALELYTGLDVSLSFLYILPLLLFTSLSNHWRSGILASLGLTLLAVLEYALSDTFTTHMSVPIASALLARLATYSTIALVWHGLIQTTTRLQETTAALDAERTHAWSLAVTDSLTGLVNRRMFEEQLATAIAYSRHCGQPLSVLLLDVDDFKQINDRFGHATGDAALCEVALALTAGVRAGDVPARIGGDEFAVVLPATDLTQAQHIAQRIKARLAPFNLPVSANEQLAISIGLACLPPPAFRHGAGDGIATATIASALLDRADRALYQAKAQKQPPTADLLHQTAPIQNVVA
jgi:diguanylate cyclase (GGDEF)-like protein